eukprot:c7695_g2_i1.p2 GENE.c7695_g2_i1~~c7695_g2_i1.p2  ORF type:complete len:168 (-),score=43.63 c7695_g2_i1:102-605(-)
MMFAKECLWGAGGDTNTTKRACNVMALLPATGLNGHKLEEGVCEHVAEKMFVLGVVFVPFEVVSPAAHVYFLTLQTTNNTDVVSQSLPNISSNTPQAHAHPATPSRLLSLREHPPHTLCCPAQVGRSLAKPTNPPALRARVSSNKANQEKKYALPSCLLESNDQTNK